MLLIQSHPRHDSYSCMVKFFARFIYKLTRFSWQGGRSFRSISSPSILNVMSFLFVYFYVYFFCSILDRKCISSVSAKRSYRPKLTNTFSDFKVKPFLYWIETLGMSMTVTLHPQICHGLNFRIPFGAHPSNFAKKTFDKGIISFIGPILTLRKFLLN